MWIQLWIELMVLQILIGYCFVLGNAMIGMYNIKDLNTMKGDLSFVKAHKWFGRTEVFLFYSLVIQCLYMFYVHVTMPDPNLYQPSGVWAHSWIGGFLAFFFVTFKVIIAKFFKDKIYKYGQLIGPIGVTGWSLAHWTSLYNFYFVVLPSWQPYSVNFIPANFIFTAIIPFIAGISLYFAVLLKRGIMGKKGRFAFNQIAFILHGITFGYEKSATDLVGTPAIFKYVIPRTYQFLERLMTMSGIDMKQLEKMSLPDAMKEFMNMTAHVGMAEKVKIKWESEDTFTIESINCSTAAVRSVMSQNELVNAICPWAIMVASVVNKITGKELEIEGSEFNEIGAKTRLKIIDNK